jgi:hypothetical protein
MRAVMVPLPSLQLCCRISVIGRPNSYRIDASPAARTERQR